MSKKYTKKEENRKRQSNNPIAVAHSKRGGAGAGFHRTTTSFRHQKHKTHWLDLLDTEDLYTEDLDDDL